MILNDWNTILVCIVKYSKMADKKGQLQTHIQFVLYGDGRNPPKIASVKQAWEEIATIVSSAGIPRTSHQCRKRYNDIRRRGKSKLASINRARRVYIYIYIYCIYIYLCQAGWSTITQIQARYAEHYLWTQHVEPWRRWATVAEDHTGCRSCQLRTGFGLVLSESRVWLYFCNVV